MAAASRLNERPSRWLASGFSLIELLVVFALMALLSMIVPVAYDRMRDGAQYRDTLRQMTTAMRQARSQAAIQQTTVRFELDMRGRTFGVEGGPRHVVPESVEFRATVGDVELTDTSVAAIRFLPRGGATGGSVDIVRKSGGGTRLRVDWMLGEISQEPLVP